MDTRSLRSKGSQETLASLVQLDPAPIEAQFYEEYDDEKDLPPLPSDTNQADSTDSLGSSSYSTLGGSGAASPTSTSRGVGLSGSGHGAIYYRMIISYFLTARFRPFSFSLPDPLSAPPIPPFPPPTCPLPTYLFRPPPLFATFIHSYTTDQRNI